MRTFMRRAFGVSRRSARGGSANPTKPSIRPSLETLEDRVVPSTVNMIGWNTYLNTSNGQAPQKLAITAENVNTGIYTGTWTDAVHKTQIPVSGQILTQSYGTWCITASGSIAGESVSYSGSANCLGSAQGALNEKLSAPHGSGAFSASLTGTVQVGQNLGREAVLYGMEHLGQSFGSGQCTDFVNAALQAVGAKGIVVPTNGSAYQWGTLETTYIPGQSPLSTLNAVQPGEILQMWNTTAYGVSNIHHTAIVVQNLGNGHLLVLEQNYNNQKFVTLDNLDLTQYKGGQVQFFQPVAA